MNGVTRLLLLLWRLFDSKVAELSNISVSASCSVIFQGCPKPFIIWRVKGDLNNPPCSITNHHLVISLFFNYTSFFNVFNLLQLHVHLFVYLDNKYKHLNRCNDIYNQTNYHKVMKLKTSKLSDLPKINTRNKSEIVMALLWMTHISAGGLL